MKRLMIGLIVALATVVISSCAAKREPCPAFSKATTENERNS